MIDIRRVVEPGRLIIRPSVDIEFSVTKTLQGQSGVKECNLVSC